MSTLWGNAESMPTLWKYVEKILSCWKDPNYPTLQANSFLMLKKKNIIYLNLAASLASPMHGEQAKHAHCIHGYGNPRTLTRTRDCHLHKHEPSHSFRPHHHQLHTVLLLWCYHTLPPWYTPLPNDTHPRGTHLQYLFSRGTTSQTAHVAVLCTAHHRRMTAAKDSKGQRNNLPIMCSVTHREQIWSSDPEDWQWWPWTTCSDDTRRGNTDGGCRQSLPIDSFYFLVRGVHCDWWTMESMIKIYIIGAGRLAGFTGLIVSLSLAYWDNQTSI